VVIHIGSVPFVQFFIYKKMTGIFQTIKARLTYFSGSVIVFCLLIFAIQYNNYFFTSQFIGISNLANDSKNNASRIGLLHEQFVKTEVFDDKFYETNHSLYIDSLHAVVNNFQTLLDSIIHEPFINSDQSLQVKVTGLKADCQALLFQYSELKPLILNRGLFTTGKSGEWTRFGNYLEELAASFQNNSVYQSITAINKARNAYQYNRSPQHMQTIIQLIASLSVQISAKNTSFIKGLSASDQLKLVSELENYSALSSEIQKLDISIGLSQGNGVLEGLSQLIGQIQTKSMLMSSHVDELIDKRLWRTFQYKILFILLVILLYVLFIRYFIREVTFTVDEVTRFASELTLGKLPTPLKLKSAVELSRISELLNTFVGSLREKIRFASNLGAGSDDNVLIPLSDDDTLSNALLDMEKSLNKAKEEDEKYKVDEQKRAWANEGIAKFSEILRTQTDNLITLSDEIILHLVKYLNANQGSIFHYNDSEDHDHHLELLSSFAYDRKKFVQKRIELGEGLVGTCALEKQTIYITDVPANYIEISSGLGDAPPRNIIIVPMKTEKNILGILELASFNVFRKYEVDFVEKIAQNIASTFASVKININTNRLLEQSKRQAEEMAQQEEEMRQNFEELQATQEESARKEAEIASLIMAVDSSSLVIQTDMDGRIVEVNNKFSQAVGIRKDELMGRSLKNIFAFNTQVDDFYNLIHDLKQGLLVTRSEQISLEDGSSLYFEMSYSPISDRDGKPYKVFAIASNLTHSKNLEKEVKEKNKTISHLEYNYRQFEDLIDTGFVHCTLSPDGTIKAVNDNYLEITGYNKEEVLENNYKKFLKPDELRQFEVIWPEIVKDKTYKGVQKRTKPTGEEYWLMVSFVPFKNENDIIEKVHLFALDITEKKLKYQVLEEANKEIERLKGLQKQGE
jgi:PAS domain S-box-containing protein